MSTEVLKVQPIKFHGLDVVPVVAGVYLLWFGPWMSNDASYDDIATQTIGMLMMVLGICALMFTLIGFLARSKTTITVFTDRVELNVAFWGRRNVRLEGSKIEAVDTARAPLTVGTIVRVSGSGSTKVRFARIGNADAERLVEAIRSISSRAHGKDASPVAGQDLATQLASLKALHEQGVLSDDEFSAAKGKLLN